MEASAHGRALAMFRAGQVPFTTPTVFANGEGVAGLVPGTVTATDAGVVPQTSGRTSVVVGSLSVGSPVCTASGQCCTIAYPGFVSLHLSTPRFSIPGEACGHPGTASVRAETIHFGSSMAGASSTVLQRTDPTRSVTEYDSQGPTNSDVVTAYPTLWLDAMISNSGQSTLYVMFFDASVVPTNGTLPMRQPIQVGAGGQTFIDIGSPGADGIGGRPTKHGLCWAASTTSTTLTVDTGSSVWCTARTIPIGS